ncbi:nucleotide-diphospho-sugar transferase [Paraphoma chrysanthemicola]|nr:nucleotide-diphospho-sugar transferase [Paraphoma chrysanthemicola]
MKRRHNVIATTLLILGIIYLSAQREGNLLGYSRSDDLDPGHAADRTKFRAGEKLPAGAGSHTRLAATPSPSPGPIVVSPEPELASPQVPAQVVPLAGPVVDHTSSPSDSTQQQHEDHGVALPFNPEFAFQQDLQLELPFETLKELSNQAPLHYDPTGSKTYAFATFMATRNPSVKDPYFLAIHSLIHRVLWSPRSCTQKNYPFIVFVADFVTPEQRALLTGAGAVVRELKPLPWHCDSGAQKRWNDLFAKLNMWAETEFERILFLDADAFPLTNIDEMFELAPVQNCVDTKLQLDDFTPDQKPICEPYIFSGVPMSADKPESPEINVGAMVFTPSLGMHTRLVQNYLKTNHYDCKMAEQAFLNWQFSPGGAYPPTTLERKWGGFFPKQDRKEDLKVVHEKMWAISEGWLKEEWERAWEEMRTWYSSGEFVEARKGGLSA